MKQGEWMQGDRGMSSERKRLLAALLTAAMALCLLLPATALAADNPAENTMPTNDVTIDTNFGTVTTNNGTVTDNRGTVTTNNSSVQNNRKMVKINASRGTVGLNFAEGTVETNNGKINTNSGTVTTNASDGRIAGNDNKVEINNGTIDANNGTVTTNASDGRITENDNEVTTNNGTVTENEVFGRVETNNGTVTTNFGEVLRNASGGTVHNFGGRVDNDGGTVYEYYKVTINGAANVSTIDITNPAGAGMPPAGENWVRDSIGMLSITPNTGYIVILESGTGTLAQSGSGYTLSSVTSAVTLSVETPTYIISLSPTNKDFGTKSQGYLTRPAKETVTVKNDGNSAVTLNSPTASTGYEVTTPDNWSDPLAPNATRDFSVQPELGLGAGTYAGAITVSTTQGGSATFSPTFVVNGGLSVNVTGDPGLSILAGQSTELTANATGGTGEYTYAWSGGGLTNTTQKVTVSPTATTTYTLKVTDQGDSSKTATAIVTVTPAPPTTYTVTVINGTGGGAYTAGESVSITADAPAAGKQFEKWTANRDGVVFADKTASQTTFAMPAGAVTVTATYADTPPSRSGSSIAGGVAYTGNAYSGQWNGSTLTVQADCAKLTSVSVDGVQLRKDSDYSVDCGSTIIAFTPAYLATLKDGAHAIRVQFTDGQYTGSFTTPFTMAVTAIMNVPATGSMPLAWAIMAMAAGIGLVIRRRIRA
ncbi:MAG: hypothetical protein Q4E65_02685 [Clostridia bacterium]|nr:hypothetical protein [Clostridia bacterium]